MKGEKEMSAIRFRNFNVVDCDSVETLIDVEVNLKAFAAGYADRQLQIPEWVGEQLTSIDFQIKGLVQAERKAEIKMLLAQEAALAGREERRASLAKRRQELEAML